MKEIIICSAIHFPDMRTPENTVTNVDGIVMCGHRHPHIIGQITNITGKRMSELQPYTQGFLTNLNRFVDRKEAMKIAFKQKQLKRLVFSGDLYSEDIY